MSADLHDQIRAEVERRLAIARAADAYAPSPWKESEAWWPRPTIEDRYGSGIAYDVPGDDLGSYIALHDPAGAIRRYEYALKVLDRHATSQGQCAYCASLCHSRSGLGCDDLDAPAPCLEITDLASSLGIEVSS